MKIEVKVPSLGESISSVQLSEWLVENKSVVSKDDEIAEIDSDKATLSVYAPESGKIHIMKNAGESVEVGEVICTIDTSEAKAENIKEVGLDFGGNPENKENAKAVNKKANQISPIAKKLMAMHEIGLNDLAQAGVKGRIRKADILDIIDEKKRRGTTRKKMSPLRLKISERLVAVKNETAMLTTFNEVDMSHIIELRKTHKDVFSEQHGVKLGFMSFFSKAASIALMEFPDVNAMIDGSDIVYHNYVDISIAVSTPKGLMVPVIRNTHLLSLAETEQQIAIMAEKARNGKLSIEDMQGGTFSITNGGVFGSLMATPIINPPQSAILGMHAITDRPVARSGNIEIRPMMYIALSYDHRIIDGKESVSFLMRIKEILEQFSLRMHA